MAAVRTVLSAETSAQTEFHRFFEAEHRRLTTALYLITGDTSEAEELSQEAMVRMYERWDRVRRMDSPTGYLYRTALNLHRSRLRRLAVAARHIARPVPHSDPAAAAETRDTITRLLASLPAGQRAALVLVGWLGMDSEEAGRTLGIEAVSVRVRVSRAKASLRALEEADG